MTDPNHPIAKPPVTLEVVKYGHPVLRQKGARVEKITPEIKALAAAMLETMHANKGIGLAAQQVGQALQLTVLDLRGVTDRPSTLKLDGQDADPAAIMPLVLINPAVQPAGERVTAPEGCGSGALGYALKLQIPDSKFQIPDHPITQSPHGPMKKRRDKWRGKSDEKQTRANGARGRESRRPDPRATHFPVSAIGCVR